MSELNDIKIRLRDIIEGTDSLSGKCFDIAVIFVIVVSMVSFVIETLPNLSDSTKHLLRILEKTTLFLFVGEYLLRLWVAEKPLKYASSFFGIVDLLATLPGVILTGVDARAIRSLRLLRLLRLLKLARYNRAVRRLYLALKLTWEELVLFVIVSLILLFVASAGIYQFEKIATARILWDILPRPLVVNCNSNNCWLWRCLSNYTWRPYLYISSLICRSWSCCYAIRTYCLRINTGQGNGSGAEGRC